MPVFGGPARGTGWECREVTEGMSLRYRILRAVLVVVAFAAAPVSAGPAVAPAPRSVDGGVLLPDSEGTITELLVHFAPEMEYEQAPVLRDLFLSLSGETRLLVLCPSTESVEHFVKEWGQLAGWRGREVYVINVGVDISIWARDRRFSRYNPVDGLPARTFVPAPFADYEFWQLNEMMVPFLLGATGLTTEAFTSPLRIEGGNAVTSGSRLFTGTNVFVDNEDEDHPAEFIVDEIEQMFGITPILVGDASGQVPWCHVDMYLTPVDDNTVLVASPVLASSLLTWAPDDDLFCDEEGGCLLDVATDALAYQDRFDQVADQLREQGFNVLRLPAVVDEPDDWMMTYNNVLMEERNGRRIVYMPVYNVTTLDVAAAAVYSSLGFDVETIDVSRLFPWGGTIRCTVNVTSRRPRTTPAPVDHPAGHLVVIDLAQKPDRAVQIHPAGGRALAPQHPEALLPSVN